jgi:putative transposase
MTIAAEYRHGRHVLAALHVHHRHLLVEYPPKVPVAALVNSLKGVSARRLRQRYRVRTHREYLWSPSYFAASCGGVPPSIIQAYVEGQRKPD